MRAHVCVCICVARDRLCRVAGVVPWGAAAVAVLTRTVRMVSDLCVRFHVEQRGEFDAIIDLERAHRVEVHFKTY